MMITQVDQTLIEMWEQELAERVEKVQSNIQGAVAIWNGVLVQIGLNDLIDQEEGLELRQNGLAHLQNLISQVKEKIFTVYAAFLNLESQRNEQRLDVQQPKNELLFLTARVISVAQKLKEADEAFRENNASFELLNKVSTLFKQGGSVHVIYKEEKELPEDIWEGPRCS